MTAFAKSMTILIVTLVVGALAGAAITGVIVQNRLDKARAFTTADGFVVQFTDVIEPLTKEQRGKIEPLVSTAGSDIQDVIRLTRLELFLIIEQLDTDLRPHLTDEQYERLQMRRAEIRSRFDDR